MTDNLSRPPAVVLASASAARASVLRAAGLAFAVDPASLDEESVKASLRDNGADGADAAETLAGLKAAQVCRNHPGALVIGADQMLECEGVWFDKPADTDGAREHLLSLRGRTHELISAVCVWRDGEALWRHAESARLTMRPFSTAFLEHYLEAAGDGVCDSVGAYRIEGIGAQLFSAIDGNHFTILGLPLLPLLGFLREHGVILE